MDKWELSTLPFLEVKQSSLPSAGRGLFVTATFDKYTPLLRYDGVRMNREEIREKYEPDKRDNARKNVEGWRYVIELYGGRFIDASDPQRSNSARYINHGRHGMVNCEFTQNGIIQTTRRVWAGEELLISYGPLFTRALKSYGTPVPTNDEYKVVRRRLQENFIERFLSVCNERSASAACSLQNQILPCLQ
jgi:SET domain-containing protein